MSDDDMRIVPERDEIRPRSAQTNGKRPAASRKAEDAPRKSAGPGMDISFWVMFAIIVLVSTATAYLYIQTRSLAEERDALAQRVSDIESKLSVTDESLSQSGAAMQAKIREQGDELALHMSEIRKLWAIAYDRNRPAIDELEQQQKSTKTRLDSLASSVAKVDPIIKGYDGMQSRLETISSQLMVQSATLDELSGRTRNLTDKTANMESTLKQQSSSIKQHGEAIDAIDEYRLQMNQRLLRLEQSLAPAGG